MQEWRNIRMPETADTAKIADKKNGYQVAV